MKLENNWKQKTLENLEKDYWGAPSYDSHLVRRCHDLRKIPLDNFSIEDLRIMTGQQIGLYYLLPLVIEKLTIDLFVEGDLYKGDLLQSILKINTGFWDNNQEYWLQINALIKDRIDEVNEMRFDMIKFERCIYKK